jgi:hypothetical protein
MKLDVNASLWVTLRAHLSPALKAYHIRDCEVVYTTEGGCTVRGTQYRDMAGLRVPRERIPHGLAEQLEVFCKSLVTKANLCEGEGVLSVSIDAARVVLEHQPADEQAATHREEWNL